MKYPKPYIKRRVWKDRDGWHAQVYLLCLSVGKKTRRAVEADLKRLVWEMECGNKACCLPTTVGTTSGAMSNVITINGEGAF